MLRCGLGEPSLPPPVKQAGGSRQVVGALAVAASLALCGCGAGERDVFDAPIDLYHGLQGGTIASQRPPPPGVGQPYPGLGSVPGRPTPTTAADRQAIYTALAAERNRVIRQTQQDPLAIRPQDIPPSPSAPAPAPAPGAAPAKPAAGGPTAPQTVPHPAPGAPAPAAATDDSAPSVAVLPAANSPPPPPRDKPRPPPAPLGPLPELEARAAAGGPVPALPDQPPPAPALEGEAAPPGPPGSVNVYFRRGSATVPLDADAALRQLASERRGQPIDVRAPGDSSGRGPDAVAASLALGLRRGEAIAAVLTEAGVPAGSVRVVAEGAGQAGVARLAGRDGGTD